ncbi:hypothetical protein PG989_002097 [Apiospora arundinis]
MHHEQRYRKQTGIRLLVAEVEMRLKDFPSFWRPHMANKLDRWIKAGCPAEEEASASDVVFKHRNFELNLHLVDAKLNAPGAWQICHKGGWEVLD